MNDEVDARKAELDALTEERRRLEDVGLKDTPEYDRVAAEWDRARMAHYRARCRAGDDSDKFKAELVYIGFTEVTAEERERFHAELEEALKNMQAIFSGDIDEECLSAREAPDKFTAEMECVGYQEVTKEDRLDLDEQRERARKVDREICGDDY